MTGGADWSDPVWTDWTPEDAAERPRAPKPEPMEIRLHPDPVLRQVCGPVTEFGPELWQLAAAMLETMYAAPGRGLAAPQVGVTRRLFVMDATWRDGERSPRFFVNPLIVGRSEETAIKDEGCLSIPGIPCRVERPAVITLHWQSLRGEAREDSFSGFEAVCIQHERDHLDGILCIDHPAPREEAEA